MSHENDSSSPKGSIVVSCNRETPHATHDTVPPVEDGNIAWAIQVYNSRPQIDWCVPFIRRVYPRSRVVLISDGDKTQYADLAHQNNCGLVSGDHLMTLKTGHLYVQRLLTLLTDGTESFLFRIDPDTRMWRRFSHLPAVTSLFGTLEAVSQKIGLHRSECTPSG